MKILTVKLHTPVFNDGMKAVDTKLHGAFIHETPNGVVIQRPAPYGTILVPWQNVAWCKIEADQPKAKVA